MHKREVATKIHKSAIKTIECLISVDIFLKITVSDAG